MYTLSIPIIIIVIIIVNGCLFVFLIYKNIKIWYSLFLKIKKTVCYFDELQTNSFLKNKQRNSGDRCCENYPLYQ